ncbi:MAG: hypothetical protein K0U39_04020, partial [Alphaproteobacteria bacterium]|nr:hypothetical protein [Alphaproteobacteria bacterium]
FYHERYVFCNKAFLILVWGIWRQSLPLMLSNVATFTALVLKYSGGIIKGGSGKRRLLGKLSYGQKFDKRAKHPSSQMMRGEVAPSCFI